MVEKMELTPGVDTALRRLLKGGILLRPKRRSGVTWAGTDESLHHLTFGGLLERNFLLETVGVGDAVDTFTLTADGREQAGLLDG